MSRGKLDVRWIQRFSNFQQAVIQLRSAVELFSTRELSLLEKQGMIKAFEFTHELAWNVLKDYSNYQGNFEVKGSRDSVKEGFKLGLVNDGSIWMKMIETRNLTSHTYDKDTMEEIVKEIVEKFACEFDEFEKTMIKQREKFDNAAD